MNGLMFRAYIPVSIPKLLWLPLPEKDPHCEALKLYILEDRPNGPGTRPIDTYLRVCLHGSHYYFHSSVPSDERGKEPKFVSCRPLGPCPGNIVHHSNEFPESMLMVRERWKLKIAAGIFSLDSYEVLDMLSAIGGP